MFQEIIDSELSKARLYTAYGIVMNQFQECELTMIQAIYVHKRFSKQIKTDEDKGKVYSNALTLTFGQLLTQLKKNNNLMTSEILEKLGQLKDVRNNLAHTFFKEMMSEFYTESGRNQLIESMSFVYNQIENTVRLINDRISELYEELGFDKKRIMDIIDNNTKSWIK